MAVFRVEKTKDFTIMSNHHLRNTELSLKAKGLLSLMLSLPEDWDYTTKGLAHICKDGVDSITTALKELERHGYLTRQRLRYDNGQLGDIEYTIHEQPVSTENTGLSPKRENPRQVKPEQAKPKQAEPEQENPAQLNTNPLKTKKSKKDKSITYPSIYPAEPEAANRTDGMDRIELIEAYREIIKENIEYTKYDREAVEEPSPVEKEDKKDKNSFLRFLPGAVFDLYADSNANQEYDPDDQKIGTLKETDAGYHTAENLLAGGYFIKESKAPEGYQPDPNAHYFSITEDGQVAVVENGEAGHGFTNEAYRGNLKITKDSSDGRKDGFAIEVKSADGSYCETFTTPKSGVIEVKGLRVGIYTVTEVANRASKDYIIPDAATVEIKADQTSTVQFFNEKPEKPDNPKNPEKPSVPSNPSTPQKPVPQTGDDPYIFLYGGLLAAALIGGSVFAVYYFKKGKYSRTSLKRTAVGVSVLSLCVLVALGSGFLVFRDLNQYAESKDAYRDLAGYVEVPEQTASPESAPDPTEPKRDDTDIVLPSVDFETLRENGPDIIGWLSLPDTVLNYPVTQTDNNEYYLNHLYDGTYNKVGCLFADYENQADFSDRNTIIYGHNMRDGSMFALLNRYDEQSYFDTHRQMYLVTPKGGYVMEIFAAFAAKPEESGSETSPWQLSWKDDGAYTTWLTAMKERSAVESDVTVTCSDKVLTLSTCTPGGTGRFLVMGKLVKVDNEI